MTIPANGIFTPGGTVYILECAAPNGVLPTNISACDGNTAYAGGTLTAESDGSLDVINDSPLARRTRFTLCLTARPCTRARPTSRCVAWERQTNACCTWAKAVGATPVLSKPYYFTPPFQVASDPTDSGTVNPGDGTPEVPLAVGLPLAAMGVIGGTLFWRRRRSSSAAA